MLVCNRKSGFKTLALWANISCAPVFPVALLIAACLSAELLLMGCKASGFNGMGWGGSVLLPGRQESGGKLPKGGFRELQHHLL